MTSWHKFDRLRVQTAIGNGQEWLRQRTMNHIMNILVTLFIVRLCFYSAPVIAFVALFFLLATTVLSVVVYWVIADCCCCCFCYDCPVKCDAMWLDSIFVFPTNRLATTNNSVEYPPSSKPPNNQPSQLLDITDCCCHCYETTAVC